MTDKQWEPTPDRVKNSNMTEFMDFLRENAGLDFKNYDDMWQWSVAERAAFWEALWHFGGVRYSKPANEVLVNGDDMLESKWFVGARLNFAENLLRYRDDQPALLFRSENPELELTIMTYSHLYDDVSRVAKSLRGMGVQTGDRVVGFMPNMCEAIVAMLAAASIGAIWSSCSPDFGFQGVLDRFGQIKPKVFFTADGYFYNGKSHGSLDKAMEILDALPTIEKVIVVPYANPEPDISSLPKAVMYSDFMASSPSDIEFEQLPFDHPLYILYSSGTTGVPKCMVHGVGGTLMQHIKELKLHSNLKREDKIFYFTTTGWMMWNWLVTSLAIGATVLLFDGSPFYPDSGALWKFAEEHGMTIFGTSAKYLAAVEKDGLRPMQKFDLGSLQAVLSTGSPLSAESFRFVYNHIKADLQLSSISGGSDIVSCFALGNPNLPVYTSELQCRGLGMDVDIFDYQGNSLRSQKGELVCKRSFPSQPIYFWNDADKKKYRAAYFDTFPNIWHHGDYAELTEHGGIIMYGRSDATLNPGGVRIGTSEIYRPVQAMDEVVDSLVVGQDWDNDVRVILFVKLAAGVELDEDLAKRIKRTIRTNCTPRHVPAKIIPVADIPYTISGKKVELAVKKTIQGEEVLNRDALKNPEALDLYVDLEELTD